MVLPFWCQLTLVVLDKRSLNDVAAVVVVDNVPLFPDDRPQYQQQSLSSDQNAAGYNGSLQNQAYAAQRQYYSSPGCHSQVMQACHPQQRHSPMHSKFQQPASALSTAPGDYASSWQQPMSSVNYTGNNGTGKYRSQYCDFANQHQAILAMNQQHSDDSMKLKRQYNDGFRAQAGMQCGFAGNQQMPSSMGVNQNRHVTPGGTSHVWDMNQTLGTGTDRQRMVFQQQDMLIDHRQTEGFAGQQPKQFVAAPRHHSVNMNAQPTTITDTFCRYQNPSMMQPSRSFTAQQQASWDEPACCQSYTQTG